MNFSIEFGPMEKALRSLQEALTPPPRNDRERDGAIQRFEYTFEISWKTARKLLEKNGIVSNSPRTVIRDLAQQGWIKSSEVWMEFLEARNMTTHTYKEDTARKVFEKANEFASECENLLKKLTLENARK